jgi:NAD(P) transhydrogenase subunit alpha
MLIGILKENADGRVALTPDGAGKLKALGAEVALEEGAGAQAFYNDQAYAEHASVWPRHDLLLKADVLISIHPLPESELEQLKEGTLLISQFAPFADDAIVNTLNKYKLRAFSLDMIPRTTRAQSMDVLSSMAGLAGYQAALTAAHHLPRFFPMMITAAGSIKPAKVLVLGAGVAGLQAIATAKRLGAMVEAFDTRSAAKEEVKSLGAKFIEIEGAKDDTEAGGYAVEQSEEFIKRQQEEVQKRAMKSDVIITTAQVRGRKAPLLVPAGTVEAMQPGSVVVDLAASTGGNCELTQDGQTIDHQGVTIIGNSNLAAEMPQDASTLYSNNLVNFLKLIVKDGELHLDWDDEIVKESFVTKK